MDSSQKKDLRKKVDMILDLHKTNPKLFYDLIVEANVDPISKETGMRKTSRKRKRSSIKSKKSKAKTPTAVTSRRTASKSRKSKKPNKSRIGKKPVASPFSATKLLRQNTTAQALASYKPTQLQQQQQTRRISQKQAR